MITSGANAQVKQLLKLQKSGKERKKSRCFVAEGEKLVKEAFSYGHLQKLYLSETMVSSFREGETVEREMLFQIPYEILSDALFQEVSDMVTPQGVLGVVQMPEYAQLELLDCVGERKHFLLLDDVRDPGNLGTMMRTAEGAGMNAVFLSKTSVDLFHPKVVRATMGSIFRMPFAYVDDLGEVIRLLKERKIPVYGCMMGGRKRYDTVHYQMGAGVVIGNEANGISKEVQEVLSDTVRIPMAGKLESLNAAVAAAILMYEMAKGGMGKP